MDAPRHEDARSRGMGARRGGAVIAALVAGRVLGAAAEAPALEPEWLYNPVGRPLIVCVRAGQDVDGDPAARPAIPPEEGGEDREPGTGKGPGAAPAAAPLTSGSDAGGEGECTLALMDAHGNLHAEPARVEGGRVDLAEAIPVIWRLRRAGYLQLFCDGEPVGSALVLQPMLSRLVPVAEEAVNPNGVRYTKITAWRDETAPEIELGPVTADEPDAGEEPADPWLAHHRLDARVCSGLRVYAERDVVLRTTRGEIRIALRPDAAPNTAWNFLCLSEGGFYRDIPFHRIVPMTRTGDPFVIQAGDPTPTGSGGPGYWLPLERSTLRHDFGVVSMARDVDPDSAGSQFFIGLSRGGTARLDGHYCAFGEVVDGAQTILAIAASELADVAAGRPVDPPVIESADPIPAPPRRPGVGRPDHPVRPEQPAPEAPPTTRVPR